jgi:flagellar biosynthesis protein FliR
MIDPAKIVAQFGEQQVLAFFLVLARLAPLFVIAPLFSSSLVPARARAVVAVGLAVGLSPVAVAAGGGPAVVRDVFELAALLIKEMLVGLAFAYALAVMHAALTTAGALLDTLIGFSYGALVDPVTGNQSSVLSQLYGLVGVAVFIAIGGDEWVIRGLARTYEIVPLLDAPALGSLVEGAVKGFAGVFSAAVEVCAPVLLALVITDAAFGVVSRVVPQLNVFAVGFPAKVTVGLILIGATLPFVAGWVGDKLQRSVGTALQSLKVA